MSSCQLLGLEFVEILTVLNVRKLPAMGRYLSANEGLDIAVMRDVVVKSAWIADRVFLISLSSDASNA